MMMECEKCDDKLLHWHCRHCDAFLSQAVDDCPHCGVAFPTEQHDGCRTVLVNRLRTAQVTRTDA